MKVGLFTDLHLGIYGNSPHWHQVALDWADWISNDLKERGIDTVFFLGDFFHNRSEISVQTGSVAAEIIEKFEDFKLTMIVGNHDAYYKNRSDVHSLGLLKAHPNIDVVDRNMSEKVDGKLCLFVPWEGELPKNKKYDYVFGHFEIQSFKMNNFRVCEHGISPMNFLASMTDKVFSGHFHNRHEKKYNEGSIHYIGSCFPMDFSDVGNTRGYHILDLDNGDTEFVENTVSPKFKKIFYSKLDTYEEDDIKNNVIKIVFDEEISLEESEKINSRLNKWEPFQTFTEFSFDGEKLDDVERIDSFELVKMFDEFITELKPKRIKTIKKMIGDLYEKHR